MSFWSNFEIANLNFWRGEAYRKYFDYLDQTGGFSMNVGVMLQFILLQHYFTKR